MKKYICLYLVGSMLFGLVGCSTKNVKIESDAEGNVETVEQVSDEMQAPQESIDSEEEQGEAVTDSPIPDNASSEIAEVKEPKPLNERIVCPECCYYGMLGNVEQMETEVLYQQYSELKCCKCGLVDGEDYKAGDYIYVLPE